MILNSSEKTGQIQRPSKLPSINRPRKLVQHPSRSLFILPLQVTPRRDERVFCASVSRNSSSNATPVRSVKTRKTNRENGAVPPAVSLREEETALNTPSVKIELDFYSVLKARRVNSTEILKRSYENLISEMNGKEDEYSKETIAGQKAIIEQAAETMLDSEKRRAYDQMLVNNEVPNISIPRKSFAGALVLLLERGQFSEVVKLGVEWLNGNGLSPTSKDVALTVAKAYCDLASITLDSGVGIAVCCEELEEALHILRVCNVSSDLQMQISDALRQLGPQYILEQLSLPDEPEFAERREKGLSQLMNILWEVDVDGYLSPALKDRQNFLQLARNHLTAAQQIDVFESCPREVSLAPDELWDAAMAYIAEGYRKKWPQLILKAENVLQRLQLEAFKSENGVTDVSVEIGLCSLLLGETEKAMMHLGLRPGSTKPPDKDVIAFVKEHSPSEDDLLPGVCALAEVWLKDTILPKYKEINTMTSSLGEWFQSPTVAFFLRFFEGGKNLNVVSAWKASTSMLRGMTSAVSNTVEGITNIFKTPIALVPRQPQSVGRLNLPRVDLSKLSQSTNHTTHYSTSLVNEEDSKGPDVAEILNGELMNGSKEIEEFNSVEDSTGMKEWWKEEQEAVQKQPPNQSSSISMMFYSFFTTLMFGGAIVVIAVVGKSFLDDSKKGNKLTLPPIVTKVIEDVKERFEKDSAHGTIDVPLAEELIRRWYAVKSEALGASHDAEQLVDILHGSMLKQWSERAKTVQKDGWHWEYTLLDLNVETVSLESDGKHAVIEAGIKEKAELIDSGRKADWYSTSYTVQYDLVMKKQGWKIAAARIVYESS